MVLVTSCLCWTGLGKASICLPLIVLTLLCFYLQMSAGAFCYLVFCGICILVALYVYFIIPETKNKTFMEISRIFASRNSFFSGLPDSVKMVKFNGYGALENSLEFSGSGSSPAWCTSICTFGRRLSFLLWSPSLLPLDKSRQELTQILFLWCLYSYLSQQYKRDLGRNLGRSLWCCHFPPPLALSFSWELEIKSAQW